MLIGSRTQEELDILLKKGYVTHGRQRITLEAAEGVPSPTVRLWDDWEERQSHLYASDLSQVLEIARLDLSHWSWHSNKRDAPA